MAEDLVFREIKGDLFTAPDDFALAHCVPVSMTMGAGIARLFKYLLFNFTCISDWKGKCYKMSFQWFLFCFRSKFGRVQELKDQNAKVGGMAVIKHEKRFIYYLITKKDSFNKPTYEDLNSSLKAMKKHMVHYYFFVDI